MFLRDWTFTSPGIPALTDKTVFPESIHSEVRDRKMPENLLSCSLLFLWKKEVLSATFSIGIYSVDIPRDSLLSFRPFARAASDGASGSGPLQYFYLLNGKEYNLTRPENCR